MSARFANVTTLACKDIVFRRAHATILDRVDLSVSTGEVVSLLGVNGAGKSTLLRILLGLLQPESGVVTLDGRPLSRYRRKDIARLVAYVPQAHVATFPFTVAQIVALGRVPHAGLGRALRAHDYAAIDAALARLDIVGLANRNYMALSGGERQRVLLARALAQHAPVLVMDEPLTGLDYGHQLRMLSLLAGLAADGYAILNTTHRPEDAFSGATRAVLLEKGRVIANGPPYDVIDARSIGALYDVSVDQIDVDRYRFFIPDSSSPSPDPSSC
ncbi:ABC transporter ATP-binding protein [Paraburkholderia sp.]|uniref:ABC transporter ATP-binding protein n=1 Tax=Paraburkholderia sp. TaxID=1926495 RepID=UPI00239B37AA|nr:ABC transporter ATP-binding protein [Paraburkholderia sp.]MDE1180566.1 ABC transporter ATP-binding protein [Paraburkholderia sp.]